MNKGTFTFVFIMTNFMIVFCQSNTLLVFSNPEMSKDSEGISVFEEEDESYIIHSRNRDSSNGNLSFSIIQLNLILDSFNSYSFQDSETSFWADDSILLDNGDSIFVGCSQSDDKLILVRLNKNGQLMWSYKYSITSSNPAISLTAYHPSIVLSNSNLIVSYWSPFSNSFLVANFNLNGEPVWSNSIRSEEAIGTGVNIDNGNKDTFITADGNILITSNSWGGGILIKLNEEGNLIWGLEVGDVGVDGLNQTIETEIGDFISVGYSTSFTPGGSEILLTKINSNGELICAKTIHYDNSNQIASSIIQREDNYYILANVDFQLQNTFQRTGYGSIIKLDSTFSILESTTNEKLSGYNDFKLGSNEKIITTGAIEADVFFEQYFDSKDMVSLGIHQGDSLGLCLHNSNSFEITERELSSISSFIMESADITFEEFEIEEIDVEFTMETLCMSSSTNNVDSEKFKQINLYPNPTSDFLIIDGEENYQIILYDLKGDIIKKYYNKKRLDLGMLKSGVYILEFKDIESGKILIERIVVSK